MSAVIKPTPGRIVWFYPASHDGIGQLNGQPLAAIIAGVHNDRLVNLAVFDAYGNAQQRSNVRLVQPDEDVVTESAIAAWMPYQIGQAAKTEQLAAAVETAVASGVGDTTAAMFAETDGTSASETGLVNKTTDGENDAPTSNVTTESQL